MSFPVTAEAADAIGQFRDGAVGLLILGIEGETVAFRSSLPAAAVAEVAAAVPMGAPSYSLYRWAHEHQGEGRSAVVFVYAARPNTTTVSHLCIRRMPLQVRVPRREPRARQDAARLVQVVRAQRAGRRRRAGRRCAAARAVPLLQAAPCTPLLAGIAVEKSLETNDPTDVTEALIRGEVYPASTEQARRRAHPRTRRCHAMRACRCAVMRGARVPCPGATDEGPRARRAEADEAHRLRRARRSRRPPQRPWAATIAPTARLGGEGRPGSPAARGARGESV